MDGMTKLYCNLDNIFICTFTLISLYSGSCLNEVENKERRKRNPAT